MRWKCRACGACDSSSARIGTTQGAYRCWGLNCLVAIELKIDRFEPEHLGKPNFHLEALDRDVRKPHESRTGTEPSVSCCASSKDRELVEYARSHTLSPALHRRSASPATPPRLA
ncbi:PDDEXK nuclease domain-containing protein [Caldimonas brevitalea]|uniref:PDDEXK nuclease domain-containing protein n=1 Tax=Caldimonas brevitalea TaxID=413882 RepID=UPI0009FB614D|nr:PDDEXK nuclease domain-containing protein [Caldimonas brevitalea]